MTTSFGQSIDLGPHGLGAAKIATLDLTCDRAEVKTLVITEGASLPHVRSGTVKAVSDASKVAVPFQPAAKSDGTPGEGAALRVLAKDETGNASASFFLLSDGTGRSMVTRIASLADNVNGNYEIALEWANGAPTFSLTAAPTAPATLSYTCIGAGGV